MNTYDFTIVYSVNSNPWINHWFLKLACGLCYIAVLLCHIMRNQCLSISRSHRRSFLQLIWLLCVWLIWGERNNRIFNNVETPIAQLLDNVKFHSFWWLKPKNSTFCMVLIVGGRTRCIVWALTDHSFVYTLYDSFLFGVFSLVRLVLMSFHRLC